MSKIHLLVIDPQNDFTDPEGALFVTGGGEDMHRLASFLDKNRTEINEIHVTLDSHHEVDIAHPIFWLDHNGHEPPPFTAITLMDIERGLFRTRNAAWNDRAREYVRELERLGRYNLTLWPPHCIIGSWGHGIYPLLSDSLRAWERQNFGVVNYVIKGTNIWTEHYSAIQAEVEDPADPSTQLNHQLINAISDPEVTRVFLAGEALSHCVGSTIRDIASRLGEGHLGKLTLLTDCCSPVPGFEQLSKEFLMEMATRGMVLGTSIDYLEALVPMKE